jgi:hypothetical protein
MIIVIFLIVVLSGFFVLAGHGADETTRWKCWGAAVILWFILIILVKIFAL